MRTNALPSRSTVEITEMGGEVEEMDAPLVHMRAAEMQLMAPCDIQNDFDRMLKKLVTPSPRT